MSHHATVIPLRSRFFNCMQTSNSVCLFSVHKCRFFGEVPNHADFPEKGYCPVDVHVFMCMCLKRTTVNPVCYQKVSSHRVLFMVVWSTTSSVYCLSSSASPIISSLKFLLNWSACWQLFFYPTWGLNSMMVNLEYNFTATLVIEEEISAVSNTTKILVNWFSEILRWY